MPDYQRTVKSETKAIFEKVIAKMAADKPGSIALTAVEPGAEPNSVTLTITYDHGMTLFVLGFLVGQQDDE